MNSRNIHIVIFGASIDIDYLNPPFVDTISVYSLTVNALLSLKVLLSQKLLLSISLHYNKNSKSDIEQAFRIVFIDCNGLKPPWKSLLK